MRQRSANWPAAGFSDAELSQHSLFLELDEAVITQYRVPVPGFAEALYLVNYIRPGVVLRPVFLARCTLGLERREEALYRSLVNAARALLNRQ